MKTWTWIAAASLAVAAIGASAQGRGPTGGQGCPGCCMMRMGGMRGPGIKRGQGMMGGQGMMRGQGMMGGPMGRDSAMMKDMAVFHALLADHDKIHRSVKQLFDGVETVTESDDPAVTAKIKEHVPAMYARLKEGRGIHLVDPLFVALFKYGKQIDSQVFPTEKGVRVIETSQDPYVVKLIKAHAASVNDLVKEGMAGMAHLHDVPKR